VENEKLSIRQFAKLVGVSDVAVGKAIKTGKIVKAIDWSNPKRPKIDPILAVKEWGRNADPSSGRSDKITDTMEVRPKGKKESPTEQYEVVRETEPHPANGGRSITEIKRQTAEVKLRLAAVELKQKQGQLVDKDLVYRSLFAAGQEMRTAMQSIPDRCIDNIMAAQDRNEAHTILYNEITYALERLTEIYKRGLNDNQDEE
jgi:hypothetical protein